MAKNINGPLAELGFLIRKRAEGVVDASGGEFGRKRAACSALTVNKMYGAFHRDDSDYLAAELLGRIRAVLSAPGTGEMKSPFGVSDGETPDELRAQMRAQILSLSNERQEKHIKSALDIHVAFDLYMRHHLGQGVYRGLVVADEVHKNFNLRQAFSRVLSEVPELALNSQLGARLSMMAA